MNAPLKRQMKVPEFLAWGETQERGRHELANGRVVAMSPERVRHVRAKQAVWLALSKAIEAAGLPCEAFGAGITIVIDEQTAREPDALVHCGEPLDPDALVSDSPVIVVEVLSPSNEGSDTGEKLAEYFSVASVHHYVIVNPLRRLVIHHARSPSGIIETRVVDRGELALSPPGISFAVESLFG